MRTDGEQSVFVKHKKIFTTVILILFVLFAILLCILIGKPIIQFVDEPEKFQQWVDKSGIWGRIIFLGIVIVQVVLAIIPGEPIEIGAGYAFGAIEGSLLCIIGMAAGSMLVFALVRTIGVRLIELFFSIEKIRSLKFLQKTRRLNVIVFVLFFLPGTPKDLIAYFVGLTNMKWQVWAFISIFARIPSIITSTIGGNALGVKKYTDAIIVFAITIIISGIGAFLYRIICKKRNEISEKEKVKCKEIFVQFFDENEEFVDRLFNLFFDCCEYLKIKGEIVSMLFKIPCNIIINGRVETAYYLYGLATDKDRQGKGYIKRLLNGSLDKKAAYFVKPKNEQIIDFYKKIGFYEAKAFREKECKINIDVSTEHKELSLMRGVCEDEYTVMYKSENEIKEMLFSYPFT
ncbi:MAG: GNAT family N-acetyltransferase [Clostridia bacterium]|nr:GNAT family N-acetyltransferase [Clostridia bacterium]